MAQSEILSVDVPSAADSFTDVGTFTVPANVKRAMKLIVVLAPDWSVTAGSVRMAPVLRLTGSGLLEQSPHEYLGMFAGSSTVTTGGASQSMLMMEYDLDIPVQTGGTITPQINTLDEAVTAGVVLVNIFYDENAATAKNNMSQFVDSAGTTTADAFVAVGTFTVPQPSEGKQPKFIKAVILAVAVDQGTSAISLRLASRFRLTGSGIAEPGSHDLVGPSGYSGHIGSSASQGSYQENGTIRIEVNIPVSAGGQILAEHLFEDETPTASTVAVGLLYE